MNIQVLGMNRRPKRLHMYEYGTFIKDVLNRAPLKIWILILLTLSHCCACFAFMVMDMDQHFWTDFSHHSYLTEHSVYVPFSGGGSFHISHPPPPFSDCDCVFYILLSCLRLQHAPQQQQLINNRWQEPRRRRGKAGKHEEVGHQHLQGSFCSKLSDYGKWCEERAALGASPFVSSLP